MKTKTLLLIAVAAQCWMLAGCAPALMAPSVNALPGPGKTPADLATDHATCSAQANQQIAPLKMSANNQVVNTMLTSDLQTAAATAQANNMSLQQQFDMAYSGCMYARGETVPGYVVADEPVSSPRRRRPASPPSASAAGFVEPAPAGAPANAGFTEPPASH